jgi:aspartyl-tRNA(Asn)/glutamyl-tRNA(Gln) amidotransferase subunit B
MQWEVVIGLETHAQLTTQSKIFSGSPIRFGAEPNTQASAVDLALPGVLPVMNRGAVERAIQFGVAVDAVIAPEHTRDALELSLRTSLNYSGPHLGQFVFPANVV